MKPNLHRRSFFLLLICLFFVELFSQSAFAQTCSKNQAWFWPVPYSKSMSRGIYYHSSEKYHNGIDITGGKGQQIVAAADGIVIAVFDGCKQSPGAYVYDNIVYPHDHSKCSPVAHYLDMGEKPGLKSSKGYCNYGVGKGVFVDHGNGVWSRYQHMDTVNVSVGQCVTGGVTQLGTMGAFGYATGDHLHFEITTGSSFTKSGYWNGTSINNQPCGSGYWYSFGSGYYTSCGITYLGPDDRELKGHLDDVKGTDDGQILIYGWAYDPISPETNLNLRVNVTTDGLYWEPYIVKVNDFPREDLDYTKKGFHIKIPVGIWGKNIAVTVEAERESGKGSISLIDGDGIAYIKNEVTRDYPRKIVLNHNELELTRGASDGYIWSTGGSLSVSSYEPSDAANKNVTWTSSDTSIATVSSDGSVSAKGYGTAIITAAVVGRPNVKAECKVTVSAPPTVPPTGISLDKTSDVLEVNGQILISASLSPSNTTDKTITWSSSDTSVATVSNGVVTAVGEGSAVITAVANADPSVKAVCNVTVVQPAEESCDWVEKSYLPPNVNSDKWEIEVKNHYSYTGSDSPGSGWTQATGSQSKKYEATGEIREFDQLQTETSTLRYKDFYYYHYCHEQQNRRDNFAEHISTSKVQHLCKLPNDPDEFTAVAKPDTDYDGYTYYELTWKPNQYNWTTAWCIQNNSYAFWRMYRYEVYREVSDYTWTRDSEWLGLDQLDSNADSVTYRFRLKGCEAVSYKVTFKVVNGFWNDGTKANKVVTLKGIASDILKLKITDIPMAGSKPNNVNYKKGQWGVTPSVNTQITGDTTYTYTYAKKDSLSSTVTFKVVNGAWDDETTADKTVTLSGYEGDELKLSAGDIPAVGTKPAENYSEGSWNTTPSADTVITGNTTYTYTYKAKSEVTHTVTFKVVNGSWDDGTTADQTVTLTGYEGDSLKLTQSQIPAVGSKPNETYKIGTWDTTPDITTAITSNITYTYTYAVYENDNRVKLIVSSEEARPGEEVTVSLNIENNPGIAGMILTISYDENRLIYKGFENSGISGWYGTGVDLIWEDISQNYDVNGEIIKLKFAVLQNAKKGDALVTVICNKISDNKELKFIPVIESGKVDVIIPGDLNGDGDVDIFDVIRLRRYLVKEPVELFANPDLNRDGDVDIFDVIRLRRFLVKEPVVIY